MSLSSVITFDRDVGNSVSHTGFRTQLFSVAAGSYSSSATYGSGAAIIDSYESVTDQNLSAAAIRQQDRDVDFALKVVLNLDQADPSTIPANELRLRTFQPLAVGQPNAYLKRLPLNARSFHLPLFLDVEIINPATGGSPAGFPSVAGPGQLQARFLHGSEIALVVTDLTAGPPPTVTPLTAADLTPLFGAPPGTQLLISVRGTYGGQNNVH